LLPQMVQLDVLTRAKEKAEEVEKDNAKNLRELDVKIQGMSKPVQLLEAAPVPTTPIEPSASRVWIIGLLMGLGLGLGLAFAQGYLDNRLHSPEDAERLAALPTLGVVPTIAANRKPTLTSEDGNAVVTECYRAIRTAIQFSAVDCPIRTLAV